MISYFYRTLILLLAISLVVEAVEFVVITHEAVDPPQVEGWRHLERLTPSMHLYDADSASIDAMRKHDDVKTVIENQTKERFHRPATQYRNERARQK